MDVESCEKTPQAGRKGWVVGVVAGAAAPATTPTTQRQKRQQPG